MLVVLERSQAPGPAPKFVVQCFLSGKSTLLPSGNEGRWADSIPAEDMVSVHPCSPAPGTGMKANIWRTAEPGLLQTEPAASQKLGLI